MIYKDIAASPDQISKAVEVLRHLEPGMLRYDLFMQIARLSTLATVELVPLRGDTPETTEVLLTQRPEGDPWEGQWHVPGTVILPTDPIDHPNDYASPLGRLLGKDGELRSGVTAKAKPTELFTERRMTRRGAELSVVHYVPVQGEPTAGRFFSVEDFPHNVPENGVIGHHVGFIQQAVKAYLQSERANG